MTRLYLVRHGETFDNAAQILQGQVPGELNSTGISQAEAVREKMKDETIDAFVSSDLRRSIQTCEIIAEPHHKNVETTELLRERDWGSMTGKFIPSLPKDPKDWPSDVETIPHLKARARNFLTWIKVTFPDKTVLAVGHGIVNKAIQSVYFNKPMNEIPRMNNADVRVLDL
ncbi:MAG: histidine phosphatase family protein [Prevotella sp.]|nr:histidine phosphatase family protein [Prevotella sp.]